jgi:hypothetical protein
MHTLEIDSRPVALTNGDRGQARQLFEAEDFKNDLRSMKSDGKPLWDGSSAFNVRPATAPEILAYRQAVVEEIGDDDGVHAFFFGPIDAGSAQPRDGNAT